jgi:hypothetical protein
MAQNTVSLKELVEMIRSLCLGRHKMIRGFSFGQTSDIGASESMEFPYIHFEPVSSRVQISEGQNQNIINFNLWCVDKLKKGDSNQEY